MNLVRIDIIMQVMLERRIETNTGILVSSVHLLQDEDYVLKTVEQNIPQDMIPENLIGLIRSGKIRLEINKD